jgi:hypothetical protein
MTLQYSTSVRNARLDQVESTIGTAPKLQFFTGSMPADCATADSGTKVVDTALPSDWMAAASGGTKAKTGTWSLTGIAAGNAGYFRIKDSAGTTCHAQGTITATGGGGDMTLDNINVANGQAVTVNSFTLTGSNP